ncbi:MAG TPA: cytochrome c [Gammaproteobacteria bacterium]|jgi:cytochrome c553|nr:cytochrome c [Xanthomonadales bacterium]MCB1603047.1 cytochrome c [Xanthomonadales bacterium]HPI96614.1 cytochrome c [Gammaproteobacteria bacterium]HPQ87883.1 cytochrome c [Gammaproteobacteria bacterium]
MKNIKTLMLLVLGLFVSSGVLAKGDNLSGDKAKGEEKVKQVCQSCHGMDGQGINDTYPKLSGQFADYMIQALSDYKSGARKNPIMSGFAATLTDEDIVNVATYYSSLTEKRLTDLSIK